MDPTAAQIVAFYDSDDALTAQVASFFIAGRHRGERGIVLTTPTRWAAIVAAVKRVGGDDLDLQFVDAERVLADATCDGAIVLERLVAGLRATTATSGCVRLFGDLVSLLAQRNQLEVALEFEALGHQLARQAGIAVLCGYDLRHLDPNQRDEHVRRVEAHHDASLYPCGAPAAKPVVLIAEDFADAREMYEQFLCASGFDVIATDNGEDAVAAAIRHQPDIVLMDIRMPRMSGTDALRVLRDDSRTHHIPVVALTAHALDTERRAIMAEGFDAMIAKPCLPTDLVSLVRQTLAVATARAH